MLKYSFLVYHKEYTKFLEEIRELGVLHVLEQKHVQADEALLEKANQYKIALRWLSAIAKPAETSMAEHLITDGEELLAHVEELKHEKEQLMHREANLLKEIEQLKPWGDFDATSISKLKDAGYFLHFYSCVTREFQAEWAQTYDLFELNQVASRTYFVIVTRDENVILAADKQMFANGSITELQQELVACGDLVRANTIALEAFINNSLGNLQTAYAAQMDVLKMNTVQHLTRKEADEKLMVLEAWCPQDAQEGLEQYLEQKDVFYQVQAATQEDQAPVKLKNNAFGKMFEFVGELYDLPNYQEIDLTPFFAPFFLLFFGLCLGDAGYGLLLVLVAIYFRPKAAAHIKLVLSLLIWLGASTVVLGFLSGSFFGMELVKMNLGWLNAAKAYMLDSNKLFYAALMIGVVQILYGMVIKAVGLVIRFGWAASLSTWGWLSLLIGCGGTYIFATYTSLINAEQAQYGYYIFGGIAVLFVFILNNMKRNPLINIGAGLWDSYNMATGLLGDVLSYIRLFALSISGAVMGLVFNDLALTISGGLPIIVSQLVFVFILLFGHGLNIFMSTLGAFVHPMRLTFVEFYKNSGFEGGGKKYRPFGRFREEKKVL